MSRLNRCLTVTSSKTARILKGGPNSGITTLDAHILSLLGWLCAIFGKLQRRFIVHTSINSFHQFCNTNWCHL